MASLPSRRSGSSQPRVITASGAELRSETSYSRRQGQPWQTRVLEYCEEIGEVSFSSLFYARHMSRVRIFPALLGDDGELAPITSGPPLELLNRIQDPGGGRSQLQYSYGRLMFITGEGVLFGSLIGTPSERWRFLWIDEVEEENGVTYRLDEHRVRMEEGIGYRMWKPSPRNSMLATSSLRAVQDICEELILLTKSVHSTAITRLTNGMLLMPQEISPGAAEPIGDEDPENNPFVAEIIEHYIGQIENPGSAEARMPPLVEASYEYIDRIRWMQLHDSANDYLERDLRTEAINRLAISLDFPPEVLKGMTDANHWTARQVVHDMWRSHGAPIAEQWCDDLSEAYLRPALEDADYEDWARVVIGFDDADVVIPPDRSEDADEAYDRPGGVSPKGYRDLKGIPPSFAPDDEEFQLQLAIKMNNPALLPDKYLPHGLPEPVQQPGPDAAPQNGTDPQNGPPSPGRRDVSRPESRTASAEIMGAAKLSLIRCRELAGSRIRTYKDSCPECLEPALGKPNALVASLLGVETLKTMNVPSSLKLVQGGTDSFRSLLLGMGYPESQAAALCEMIEVFAARTLYEKGQPALGTAFAAHVDRIQETVDAMGDS